MGGRRHTGQHGWGNEVDVEVEKGKRGGSGKIGK